MPQQEENDEVEDTPVAWIALASEEDLEGR